MEFLGMSLIHDGAAPTLALIKSRFTGQIDACVRIETTAGCRVRGVDRPHGELA